jgi:hypothetical protein
MLEGALEGLVVLMVAPLSGAARVVRERRLREDPEPGPGDRRSRILARQGMRQIDPANASRPVSRPQRVCARQLRA